MLLSGCANLYQPEGLENLSYKHVKKVASTLYRVTFKDSMPIEEYVTKNIYVYNNKGRLIWSPKTNKSGEEIKAGSRFFYNKRGFKIKDITYNNDSIVYIQFDYEYNKYGLMTKETANRWGKKETTEIKWDRKNRKSHSSRIFHDGKSGGKTTRKFDENWREIEVNVFDTIGNQVKKYTKDYDQLGNLKIQKTYGSSGKLLSFTNMFYNNRNDRIKSVTSKIIDGDTITNEKGTKYEYIYDNKGNRLVERLFFNDKLYMIAKNEITYF
ncbi:MAG: hypothetical protein KJP09_09500 [Bacteroidia bacterium]|nr:hypothetical protein [Bacteroidia bacterium]